MLVHSKQDTKLQIKRSILEEKYCNDNKENE